MPIFTCRTCGAQYDPSDHPPASCLICSDDRQYVSPQGQRWTTREELAAEGVRNQAAQADPGVFSLTTEPKVGIGQQALLIQTPQGNVLWDCLGFLHPDFVPEVERLGGIKIIAISHPHFFTACADWAEAFNCKVLLAAADREWVTRSSPRLEFWEGDATELQEGVEVVRLGGHFPGSCVLQWRDGCEGRGALFTGDTLFPTPDGHVSLMYSFPNLVPLPVEQVTRIGGVVQQRLRFDRLYGPFPGGGIRQGAKAAVQRSLERYSCMLGVRLQRKFY